MRLLLNIIWLVFAGFWLALGYAALGVIAFLLIITIPFGVASFRMANYALWPFGRTVVAKPGAGAGSVVANVIWLLIAGIPIVAGHLTTAAAQAVTIIGIPLAIANIKMIPISLFPFGEGDRAGGRRAGGVHLRARRDVGGRAARWGAPALRRPAPLTGEVGHHHPVHPGGTQRREVTRLGQADVGAARDVRVVRYVRVPPRDQ